MGSERRCPSCGALVASDADWCGQCYTRLGGPQAPAGETLPEEAPGPPPTVAPETGAPDKGSETAAIVQTEDGELEWPCPVCENRNAIGLGVCAVCGTPFGRLFQKPETRREIPPKDAAAWSILVPGLGHLKSGRKPDGIARLILFAWTVGALAALLVSRFGTGGLGPTASLVYLYMGAAALVYVESAVDAYRVAAGDPPLVSSRMLMWGVVALILLSVLLGSLVVLPAARGG
ncbi:MAG: hypothetical protein AB1551_05430 [Actinomycetota bacterium]